MDHRITTLKVQERNHQRVNVYLDDEFAFGLARIVAAWLQVGQMISDEKIAELQEEDGREQAYQQALKFINYRQRSMHEIQRNLEEHQFSEEIIQGVVERLSHSGLINDSHFAASWVENRNEFHPRSRKALSLELHRRGLDEESIQQAVEAVDDEATAYQAGLKQARKYNQLEWAEFRQKLSNFLLRRGYSYGVVAPVVRQIWDEMQAPETGDV